MNSSVGNTENDKPFFFVYIVESPSPEDLAINRTEGRILQEALNLAGIKGIYSLAVSHATFIDALTSKLIQAMKANNYGPIIHFSAHGNQNGIELTDKTFINWAFLKKMLMPINEVLNGGLVICMSSCSGYSGCTMAMTADDKLPFFGLIGNAGTPQWSDSAVAFVTFYHLFSKGVEVPAAVKAMRIASGDNEFREVLAVEARQSWIKIIAEARESEELKKRLEALQELWEKTPPSKEPQADL